MQRLLRSWLPKSAVWRYGVGVLGLATLLLFIWPGLLPNLWATSAGVDKMFMPHGACYYWVPQLYLLHLSSDLLIGISYVVISLTLAYLVYRARRDIPFHWVFLAFGLFIIACGGTHFMEVWTIWNATYWLSGYVKLITAIASVATAIVLPPLVPRTLALIRSAKLSEEHRSQMEAAQAQLEALYEKRITEVLQREMASQNHDLAELLAELSEHERARREALVALFESEQRYRYLADSMPQIVWTARPDGFLDYYNQRWFDYTGMTLEQTQGWGWQPVLHPDDVEKCLKRWATAVETGRRYDIEYRFKRASDGAYRWHLGRAVPMLDEAGQIVKWFGTCTDIDDQKRAGETLGFLAEASELLASSLDYQATLEQLARLAVPTLGDYCVVDLIEKDGRIRRPFAVHSDPSKAELVSELLKYVPDSEKSEGVPKVLRTGVASISMDVSEADLERLSRSPDHLAVLSQLGLVSYMIVPLIARGRTIGALTFGASESHRHFNDTDLAFAGHLARRAALSIDNARLYQESREANRIKDEFLATLSHELRTPLTPVIGWVHMMQGGMASGADIQHGLAVIAKNSQTLTRLINDLLDMSAIMSGKMNIEQVPVTLYDTVREAVENARPQAASRNINLDLALCEDASVIVNGDWTRLVQVFSNLLNNAIKFSANGGRVRVRCETDEREARVVVEDEGKGIAPEFLPHVFERFRQSDSSKTRSYGGLGIGLALVKSFVEAHEGSVTVESEGDGRGSRFTISLPRLLSPVTFKQLDNARREQTGNERHARVLVIEDAADTLKMLEAVFELRGYQTTLCESAAEALRAAGTSHFDIIVSDIGMPLMDGHELIKRLRALPHLKDVPALALTGYASTGDADAALAAGFDAHLAKPVEPDALAKMVEQLLKRG